MVLCTLVAACGSSEQRQASRDSNVKNELARETQRICALPVGERQGQIDKALNDQGLVVVCP